MSLQIYLDGEEHLGEVKVDIKDTLSDVRTAIVMQLGEQETRRRA